MILRPGRRPRRLSEEERRLWEKVAESIEPLEVPDPRRRLAPDSNASESNVPDSIVAESTGPESNTSAPAAPAPVTDPNRPREPQILRPTGPTRRHGAPGHPSMIHVKHHERADGLAPAVPAPPSLVRLDHKTKRRLVRGSVPIDERLDLHGYTEAAAHSLLRGFLVTARARGARVVLVITGKGQGPGKERALGSGDRGILRRAVPHWLSDPTLRDVVLGFEEAHLAHGGAGAIYVRLRRPRGGGEGAR